MNYQRYSNIFYVHGYLTYRKTPALARFSPYCWNVISLWFQPIIGRFYKMRVSYNLNYLQPFLSPFINTVLSFSNTMWILSVAGDSKYNVRRCDVLVQNKTIHSLNLFALWSNISLKMATWAIGKTFHVIMRARSLHYRFYRFNLVWPPCVLLMIYVKY